jgi:DNA integrity scanning protein DisA with diadenylate cyclase activity
METRTARALGRAGTRADAHRSPDLRGTIKELAQLDVAFVISETGTVVAACRYLDASVERIDLPLGLWNRHLAGAHAGELRRNRLTYQGSSF